MSLLFNISLGSLLISFILILIVWVVFVLAVLVKGFLEIFN